MTSNNFIKKSILPDLVLPEEHVTDLIFRTGLTQFPDKVALIDGANGRTFTYKQIHEGIKKVAASLHKRGFKAKEVFCIYSPNILEYVLAFHGVLKIGGIVTTVNPLYSAEELSRQLSDCKAVYIVTIPSSLDKATEASKKVGGIREIFVFGEAEGATPFDSLLDIDEEPPTVEIDPKNDIAVLSYSSGTTGLPKGVMLSHYNLTTNLIQYKATVVDYGSSDTFFAILPFFHIYGMIIVKSFALYLGATIVIVSKFEPEPFLKVIQDYKVTIAHLVPPLCLFLAKNPLVDKYNLSNLRSIVCGAAPLGTDLSIAVSKRLNIEIRQAYGMTELSPFSHSNTLDYSIHGSAGILAPNMEAKIVNIETGESLPSGKENIGELCVRGPNVMLGYLNKPEATAATIEKDGFLRTGDIGYEENNFYYIIDRLKELIKYKGFQVPPAELEDLILTHPSVNDVAVVGKFDEESGELPTAFVVVKPNYTLSNEELHQFLENKIAPYKKLRGGIIQIDSIPKTASGKILRRVLKTKLNEKKD